MDSDNQQQRPLILICWRGKDMNGATHVSMEKLKWHLFRNGFAAVELNSRGAYLHNVTRKLWQGTTVCDPKAGPFPQSQHEGLRGYHRILVIDNDMSFEPADFDRLYEADVDIISGVYVTSDGSTMIHMLQGEEGTLLKTQKVPEGDGPVEVGSVGFGFTMLKPGVLEAVPAPWCYYPIVAEMTQEEVDALWERCRQEPTPKRQLEEFLLATLMNLYGEDVGFCLNATKHGFKIHVHPQVILTHWKLMQVNPFDAVNMLAAMNKAQQMAVSGGSVAGELQE